MATCDEFNITGVDDKMVPCGVDGLTEPLNKLLVGLWFTETLFEKLLIFAFDKGLKLLGCICPLNF